ncbi:tetratricopeptide repeat protein [Ruegeria arenilitoris]|uniref:tetratricopeptide repeat protein n=1 Tax=Ruegeria arenilitoris TaxID=1173585 RepID=UPI00147EF158|nr:tetratricopeptide repeat protein [Ruegeria arenilitoris]
MQRKADQLRAEIASISELLQTGRPDRAFKRATKAAKKWPKVAALPRLAGISAVQQQKPKLAQTHFHQAWQLDPGNAELIQNFALSLVQGGDPANALTFLKKIAARGPLSPAQQFIRALALLQEQEPEQALADVEQVLSREPANLNAQILKADILDSMHQWQDAVDVLMALVENQPKYLPGLLRLAKSQLGLGQLDEVLKNVRVVLAQAPEHPEALELMAGMPNLSFDDIAMLQTGISKSLERGTAANPEDEVKLRFAAANLARRQKKHGSGNAASGRGSQAAAQRVRILGRAQRERLRQTTGRPFARHEHRAVCYQCPADFRGRPAPVRHDAG